MELPEKAERAARHFEDGYISLDMPASWVGHVQGSTMGHTGGNYHTDFIYGDMRGTHFMIFRVDGMRGSDGSCSWVADLGDIVWGSKHARRTYDYSDAELDEVVLAMTGGSLTKEELLAAGSKEACSAMAKPAVDAFMNENVVPTVHYK